MMTNQNVFGRVADVSLVSLVSRIYSVGLHKSLLWQSYSMKILPPSHTIMHYLKMELIHYAPIKHKHVLRLQCTSLKEKDFSQSAEVIQQFLGAFFDRQISLYPIVKQHFIGAPGMSIIWVVSIAQLPEDSSAFRNRLLHEEWNSQFDCSWHLDTSSKSSYLDFIFRVMGGMTFQSKSKRSKNRRHSNEYDDLVFMKFSDRESSGFNHSLLYLIVISVCFLFCACFYIYPRLRVFY